RTLTGQAAANAHLQSQTALDATVTCPAGNCGFLLNFDADPDMRAAISELTGGGFSAQANIGATFTLTNDTTFGSITFVPRGAGAVDCVVVGIPGATCLVTADGTGAPTQQDASLNQSVSTGTNPSDVTRSFDPGLVL